MEVKSGKGLIEEIKEYDAKSRRPMTNAEMLEEINKFDKPKTPVLYFSRESFEQWNKYWMEEFYKTTHKESDYNIMINTEKPIDKYYTPSIEEFHIGFEYEFLIEHFTDNIKQDDIVIKIIIESIDDLIQVLDNYNTDKNKIRVKYLDKEDIESLLEHLNFEIVTDKPDYFNFRFNKEIYKYSGLYNHVDRTISFYDDNFWGDVIFTGKVKNKNELKRLLKQLEIL